MRRLCGNATPGHWECLALRQVRPVEPAAFAHLAISPDYTPSGYGPSNLRSAYALTGSGSTSETVAVVDAYNDPTAESDLDVYRSQYGLPACTTANGCFAKVNQNGATSPLPGTDTGWAGEISLDLDMVSAICPDCHVLLVEASSADISDLGAAENQAVTSGAKFVSNSYGGDEDGTEATTDAEYYHHPGVAITASTGDDGYGTEYPASSKYVTAVGGTTLNTASNARGWTETAWSGAGAGCSEDEAKPAFQVGVTTGCTTRSVADVSAVADPDTGVAVYDTTGDSGWAVYGGTSASSPIIAAVYALAGIPGSSDVPNAYPYAHTSALYDITSGSDGNCGSPQCKAGAGYDGPTGLGTPDGVAAFSPPAASSPVVTNPGPQTATVGTTITPLTLTVTGGVAPISWSAQGLPAGLSISTSGTISGTPTTAQTASVTVTATDADSHTGTATFSWTVQPPPATIVSPGAQTGTVGVAATLQLTAQGGTPPYSFTVQGLPTGLTATPSGSITGTPQVAGSYSVTVTLSCSSGCASTPPVGFSWRISPAPLVVTNPGPQSAAYGSTVTLQLNAAGGTTPYTWTATGLPAGLSISSSGEIEGTPTAVGSSSVVATVHDAAGLSTPTSFNFTITGTAPTITGTPPAAIAGTSYSFAYTVTGLPAPTVTVGTGLPAGLTVSTSGVLSGTTTAAGTFDFTVVATNAVTATSLPSSVTVTPGPLSRLVLSPSTSSIAAGGSQTYSARGFDVFGNSLGDVTSASSIGAATATVSIACPAAVCSPSLVGSYTVTATDGTVKATATLTVTPAAAQALAVTGGAAQTTGTGEPFPSPVSVTATDLYTNLVPGTPVTFTLTPGKASSPFGPPTATFAGGTTAYATQTNGAGVAASPTITAGPHTGTVIVTASSPGLASVTVTLTIVVPSADLSVAIVAPTKAVSGSFTETVTITNNGPTGAANVISDASVPLGATVTSAPGATRNLLLGEQWSEPYLAAGASDTYTITYNVTVKIPIPGVLTASVVSATIDPKPLNNLAATTITLG